MASYSYSETIAEFKQLAADCGLRIEKHKNKYSAVEPASGIIVHRLAVMANDFKHEESSHQQLLSTSVDYQKRKAGK